MKLSRPLLTLVLLGVASLVFATPAHAGRRASTPSTVGTVVKLVVSPA